jgi:predicted protein tyrosine phosphatase
MSCHDFKGLRTNGVRHRRDGVTRSPTAAPLIALHLYEVFTPTALAPCFHRASSHGL